MKVKFNIVIFLLFTRMTSIIATIISYDSLLESYAKVSHDSSSLGHRGEVAVVYLFSCRDYSIDPFLVSISSPSIIPFIFVDSPDMNSIHRIESGIFIISLCSNISTSYGYKEFVTHSQILKPSTSWEKALFFFTYIAPHFQFIWFIESDVYIPSKQAFYHIHNKTVINNNNDSTNHSNKTQMIYKDLVVAPFENNTNNRDPRLKKWHYPFIKPLLPPPWYHTMVCAMGMSRAMLTLLQTFVMKYHRLQFLEYLPLTLAIQQLGNYSITMPKEFQTIKYRHTYTCEDIIEHPLHWYHPIKHRKEFMQNCLSSEKWDNSVML